MSSFVIYFVYKNHLKYSNSKYCNIKLYGLIRRTPLYDFIINKMFQPPPPITKYSLIRLCSLMSI